PRQCLGGRDDRLRCRVGVLFRLSRPAVPISRAWCIIPIGSAVHGGRVCICRLRDMDMPLDTGYKRSGIDDDDDDDDGVVSSLDWSIPSGASPSAAYSTHLHRAILRMDGLVPFFVLQHHMDHGGVATNTLTQRARLPGCGGAYGQLGL